jgi:hypothetical protein
MTTSKQIDSCIERLSEMLGDANNELTSGQREELIACIRDLKRLKKATKLTDREIYMVVAQIAKAAYEVVEMGLSA